MTSSTPRQPIRRRPVAGAAVLLIALIATGGAFAAVSASTSAEASAPTSSQTQVEAGRQLYVEGCSSCHGLAAQGVDGNPSLIGVGAAAANFQIATGRMPLGAPGIQAPKKPVSYNPEQIAAISAYIATLGPGPAIPSAADLNTVDANLAEGGELFRTNCAQCHNFAGRGGALSNGAAAPSMMDASARTIYEAMLTGPGQMPMFSNKTLTPEAKRAIVKYVAELQTAKDPGGLALGSFGPVTEGVFIWVAGMGALLAAAVWIGAKVR